MNKYWSVYFKTEVSFTQCAAPVKPAFENLHAMDNTVNRFRRVWLIPSTFQFDVRTVLGKSYDLLRCVYEKHSFNIHLLKDIKTYCVETIATSKHIPYVRVCIWVWAYVYECVCVWMRTLFLVYVMWLHFWLQNVDTLNRDNYSIIIIFMKTLDKIRKACFLNPWNECIP